jgi:hypothetical protein
MVAPREQISEKTLFDRVMTHLATCQRVEHWVKEGKITEKQGEMFKRGTWRCDEIAMIYYSVFDSANSYFTAEDIEDRFEVLRWSEDSPANKPIFFKQMTVDEFALYKVITVSIHKMIAPDSPVEYCNSVATDLGNLIGSGVDEKNKRFLWEHGGWYNER